MINIARPVKYDTVDKLSCAIDKYFTEQAANDKAPTWHSMLLKLDISDDTLLNYRNNKDNKYPGYSEAIKRAERRLSEFWQQFAIEHPNLQSYCIFQLKQPHNGGLSDKTEVSQDVKIQIQIGSGQDKLLE